MISLKADLGARRFNLVTCVTSLGQYHPPHFLLIHNSLLAQRPLLVLQDRLFARYSLQNSPPTALPRHVLLQPDCSGGFDSQEASDP
jgi:hypothetical protein